MDSLYCPVGKFIFTYVHRNVGRQWHTDIFIDDHMTSIPHQSPSTHITHITPKHTIRRSIYTMSFFLFLARYFVSRVMAEGTKLRPNRVFLHFRDLCLWRDGRNVKYWWKGCHEPKMIVLEGEYLIDPCTGCFAPFSPVRVESWRSSTGRRTSSSWPRESTSPRRRLRTSTCAARWWRRCLCTEKVYR